MTQYKGVAESFKHYWEHYGGLSELLYSPYFHIAFVSAICLAPAWADKGWFETVIQVLPNIVGFSIGGFAVWLGFGNEKFRAVMTGPDEGEKTSPYLEASATFTHFVAVQITALIAAVFAKALDFVPAPDGFIRNIYAALGVSPIYVVEWMRLGGAFLGLLVFFYALALTFATVLALMRLAIMFDRFQDDENKSGNKSWNQPSI